MFKGLKSQILFLSLLPTLMITLIMAVYMNVSRVQDLQHYVNERGQSSALQIANLAKLDFEQTQDSFLNAVALAFTTSKARF